MPIVPEPERSESSGTLRSPDITYVAPAPPEASTDYGTPCTVIYQVFDSAGQSTANATGSEWTITPATDAMHAQIKLLTVRESGAVHDIWIQRTPVAPSTDPAETLLHLGGDDARRLIALFGNLAFLSVRDDPPHHPSTRVVDLGAEETALAAYRHDPEVFRGAIANDQSAHDVVALAHRRSQVEKFRRLLGDPAYFKEIAGTQGREAVWQQFLEQNPWVLGISLGGQLLTSWDDERLERIVAGSSIAGPGKRVDALLKTAGRIQSMVFVELKHHETPLLGTEYRSGCWRISDELAGAVSQMQGTVHLATQRIGERLAGKDEGGYDVPGQFTYLVQPRSYVVAGQLSQFVSDAGGEHQDKIRSFELFRRNIHQPQIITYDELLARAEWLADGPGEG